MKCFVIGLLTMLTAGSLSGCATSHQPAATHQVPGGVSESWRFNFDSRQWELENQGTMRSGGVLANYVLRGQTVHNWTELVSTQYHKGSLVAPNASFEVLRRHLSRDCPSLRMSTIEESTDNIIFEWRHDGCQGHPPQHEIGRLSRGRTGSLSLTYVEKTTQLASEKRSTWISIIRAATIETVRSLTLQELGPLPPNASSEYLETVSSEWFAAMSSEWFPAVEQSTAWYEIKLRARKTIAPGAVLLVQFENPENPDSPFQYETTWPEGERELLVSSPKIKTIKCWNYRVTVHVYRDGTKSEKLGTHQQTVQSNMNVARVDSLATLFQAKQSGRGLCP